MKPAPFEHHRATTVKEAIGLLGQHGGDAKILAGGQSLVPMMKLRLARPSALVDVNRVRELDYVRHLDGHLAFGALARVDALETETVRTACPLLARAARDIAHAAIRHRSTVCGSLAHADPAAELPMLALALDAELVITGVAGQRVVPASEFFVTYLTTALATGEMLTEARFPVLAPRTGWAFQELARRPGDFAIAAAAVMLEARDGTISRARIALGAVADRPVRATEAETALVGARPETRLLERAAELAAAPLAPPSDVHGTGAYRRHLARVLVRRALTEASERLTTAAGR